MYLRPEELHEVDSTVDIDICHRLQSFWSHHTHDQGRSLGLDQIDVLWAREVAGLSCCDGSAFIGSDDVVVTHLSRRQSYSL